jgi:hypothetical protein
VDNFETWGRIKINLSNALVVYLKILEEKTVNYMDMASAWNVDFYSINYASVANKGNRLKSIMKIGIFIDL